MYPPPPPDHVPFTDPPPGEREIIQVLDEIRRISPLHHYLLNPRERRWAAAVEALAGQVNRLENYSQKITSNSVDIHARK